MSRRWDRGAAGGECSLDTREARGRLGHLLKNAQTAMLPSVPRQDQRSLIVVLLNGVIHVRVQRLDRRAVGLQVLLGTAIVLGKRS